MLFYLSVFAFFLVICILAFRFREALIPCLPERIRTRIPSAHYTPLPTFAAQAEAGLSSNMFDIQAHNLDAGDSRSGLDEQGTQEVLAIMRRERVTFDQARLIRHNQILARNGIDPTGMPLDSKAVTRL